MAFQTFYNGITPTQPEKKGWSRMAQAAYQGGDNYAGNRYTAWASLPNRRRMPVAIYDSLMLTYRRWLIGDVKFSNPITPRIKPNNSPAR